MIIAGGSDFGKRARLAAINGLVAQSGGWRQLDYADPINAGLVGYWPLNGGTVNGGVASDLSGNAPGGALVNSPHLVPGLFGQALNFSGGSSQAVTAANPGPFSNKISMFAWVNFSSLANAYTGILSYGITNTTYATLYIKNGGLLAAYIVAAASYDGSGTHTLSTGTWYHIGFTYDGATLTGYVNGAVDGAGSGTSSVPNGGTFAVGEDFAFPSGRYMSGAGMHVRLYNRALSAAEVYRIYSDTSGNLGLQTQPRRLFSFSGATVAALSAAMRAALAGRAAPSAAAAVQATARGAATGRAAPSAAANVAARSREALAGRAAPSAVAPVQAATRAAATGRAVPSAAAAVQATTRTVLTGRAAPGIVALVAAQGRALVALAGRAAPSALSAVVTATRSASRGKASPSAAAGVTTRARTATTGRAASSASARVQAATRGALLAVFRALFGTPRTVPVRVQAVDRVVAAQAVARVVPAQSVTRIVKAQAMASPERAGNLHVNDADTRGMDFTAALTPVGDTLATVTLSVARRDGANLTGSDLTLTSQWISGNVVYWWAQSANLADYQVTVTATTTGGRTIKREVYQAVVPALG